MSVRYEVLPQAMEILGARSVAVFSVTTGDSIWSITGSRSPIDEVAAAAAIDVVAAARQLVDVADPGSPLDEILVVDTAWFHVLYILTDHADAAQVAHLLLDRGVANLAQARRDFRAMVGAEREVRRTWEPVADGTRAAPPPETADTPNRSGLPQRTATSPARHETHTGNEARDSAPWWAEHTAAPFAADVPTLQRVLDRLRRL